MKNKTETVALTLVGITTVDLSTRTSVGEEEIMRIIKRISSSWATEVLPIKFNVTVIDWVEAVADYNMAIKEVKTTNSAEA